MLSIPNNVGVRGVKMTVQAGELQLHMMIIGGGINTEYDQTPREL